MHKLEPHPLEPCRHVIGSYPEPAVGVVLAEKIKIVRREIDDQQSAALPEDAGTFQERLGGIV